MKNFNEEIKNELDAIRRVALQLKGGQKYQLLNSVSRITGLARRSGRVLEEHAGEIATDTDIARRYNANKAIFNAMAAGRRISLKDSAEFRVSEMHTQICVIRRKIEKQNLPYILCDKVVKEPGKAAYKEYWLIAKETQPQLQMPE